MINVYVQVMAIAAAVALLAIIASSLRDIAREARKIREALLERPLTSGDRTVLAPRKTEVEPDVH